MTDLLASHTGPPADPPPATLESEAVTTTATPPPNAPSEPSRKSGRRFIGGLATGVAVLDGAQHQVVRVGVSSGDAGRSCTLARCVVHRQLVSEQQTELQHAEDQQQEDRRYQRHLDQRRAALVGFCSSPRPTDRSGLLHIADDGSQR